MYHIGNFGVLCRVERAAGDACRDATRKFDAGIDTDKRVANFDGEVARIADAAPTGNQ
jgi:hypothetical protein